jgi:hypothetical protein
MKVQSQVCSLSQAIALEQKGIIQNSLFYHLELPETVYRKESMVIADKGELESATHKGHYFSAFNVAELGVMLPDSGGKLKGLAQATTGRCFGGDDNGKPQYFCKYPYDDFDKEKDHPTGDHDNFFAPSEAQARAEMLIYLLEKNYTTPEEVNNRLLNS